MVAWTAIFNSCQRQEFIELKGGGGGTPQLLTRVSWK